MTTIADAILSQLLNFKDIMSKEKIGIKGNVCGIDVDVIFFDTHPPDDVGWQGFAFAENKVIAIYIRNDPKSPDPVGTYIDQEALINLIIHELAHIVDYNFYGYSDFKDNSEKIAVFTSAFARQIIEEADRVLKLYKEARE